MSEDAPVIRREVYPVRADLPDGRALDLAKMVVTLARVYLFVGGGPEGVTSAFDAAYTTADLPPSSAPRSDPYRVETDLGLLVAYRLPGCGCHAGTLKRYRPFSYTAERFGPR